MSQFVGLSEEPQNATEDDQTELEDHIDRRVRVHLTIGAIWILLRHSEALIKPFPTKGIRLIYVIYRTSVLYWFYLLYSKKKLMAHKHSTAKYL